MSSSIARTPLRILVTGVTGYIGGSVLDRLLAHPKRSSFELTSYARNAAKAHKLEAQFGVKSVLGSLDDVQTLEDAAAAADVVIHTADADHLPAAQAILRGLKRRHASTGAAPTFIHTSGTGVLMDDSYGVYRDGIKYDDADVESIRSIPKDAIHRNIDLEIVAADQEGYVRTYIVLPSAIYGLASGPIFSAGLANRQSVFVPWVVKAAIAHGQVGVFGEGTNVWPFVHIDDTADMYMTLFNTLLDDLQRPGHGWEGFYFAETGSLRFGDVANSIDKALVQLGIIKSTGQALGPWTDEAIKYFGGLGKVLGTNCHAVASRARALGWTPKYTAEDCHATILPEVEYTLSRDLIE